jgi:ribonuclease HI
MLIGGLTQYLTRVQGMPTSIENTLSKRIQQFMWCDGAPMINIATMQSNIAQGGRKLLDIKARNQAIDLMKVKSYLNISPNHPKWAIVTDHLVTINIPKQHGIRDSMSAQNPFLQSWRPTLRPAKSALPASLRQMFQVAWQFGVAFTPIYDGLNNPPPADTLTPDAIPFNPSIHTSGVLMNGFRVFTNSANLSAYPALRIHAPIPYTPPITAYTNGSCTNNGTNNAKAGCGVWYTPDDPRNTTLSLPPPLQSNNTGELAAILTAVQCAPLNSTLHIISHSKYAIDGLTKHLQSWDDAGWINTPNTQLLQAITAHLRHRGNITTFRKAEGHGSDPGNTSTATLAATGAAKPTPDPINLTADTNFRPSGAKLSTASQALLYRGIIAMHPPTIQTSTSLRLQEVKTSVMACTTHTPTSSSIWRSVRHKDISRNIRIFLWKCLHNALHIGSYWSHIPGYEPRAHCPACANDQESLDHILFHCMASGQNTIWPTAQQLWQKKGLTWPALSLGSALGCGISDFQKAQGKQLPGANRFYTILMSESIHMIWKIRCEWRIDRESDPERLHTTVEIRRRWLLAINNWLRYDCLLTNKLRYGRKALRISTVHKTWSGTLRDEAHMPDNWHNLSEVLVGIG